MSGYGAFFNVNELVWGIYGCFTVLMARHYEHLFSQYQI